MWEYEYGVETAASPERVWQHWSEVAAWPKWNAGIESIRIDGPFAPGTTFTMTPPAASGQDPIALQLVEVEPGRLFVDEMDAGDFVVRTEHRIEPLDSGRTRLIYRMEISGPTAAQVGPELGPAITADFPEVLAALVALAEA